MVFVADESKSQQTKTIEETLSPSWREWLTLTDISGVDEVLTVRLMDADVIGAQLSYRF